MRNKFGWGLVSLLILVFAFWLGFFGLDTLLPVISNSFPLITKLEFQHWINISIIVCLALAAITAFISHKIENNDQYSRVNGACRGLSIAIMVVIGSYILLYILTLVLLAVFRPAIPMGG